MRESYPFRQKAKLKGMPPLPLHTIIVSLQGLLFSNHIYMLPASLIVSREWRSRQSDTSPRCSVYHLDLCLSTTHPSLLCFTVQAFVTWYPAQYRVRFLLFTVPTAPFIVHHHPAKSNDTTRQISCLSLLPSILPPSSNMLLLMFAATHTTLRQRQQV